MQALRLEVDSVTGQMGLVQEVLEGLTQLVWTLKEMRYVHYHASAGLRELNLVVVTLVAEIEGWVTPREGGEVSGLLLEAGDCLLVLGVVVVVLQVVLQVPTHGVLCLG